MKSYRYLEIYQLAYRLAIEEHALSLTLPKYELNEQVSQVRRYSKRIKDHIAEACLPVRQGYGRRRYKDEFIRFLVFAQSSCGECTWQLNMI